MHQQWGCAGGSSGPFQTLERVRDGCDSGSAPFLNSCLKSGFELHYMVRGSLGPGRTKIIVTSRRLLKPLVGWSFLVFFKEILIDLVGALGYEPEFMSFEHFNEGFTINETIGGTPSRRASFLASSVNVPVVMIKPLSARPIMAPRKSRT